MSSGRRSRATLYAFLAALLAAAPARGFEWPGSLEADARDLRSTDDAARLAAVLRLATRDVGRTRALLVPMLADRDPGVRLVAARVLARAGAPEALEAATAWITSPAGRDRPLGLQVLRDAPALTPAARRATERALADAEPAVRAQALDVLARQELGPSFGAVAAAVDDDNREVRARAVRLLAEARDPRAAVPILARLSDSDRPVRLEALRALGVLGDARVIPALLRQLDEASDDLRVAAVDALARLKAAAATPTLIALARRRPTDELARHAELALGDIATAEAVDSLVALGRDPPTTDELREALRRAGERAVPALIRELDSGSSTGTALACWALGEIGDRRATAPLGAIVERQTSATPAALAALATLADPRATVSLLRAAASAAPETRRLAYDALVATADDRAVVLLERGLVDLDAGVRVRAVKLAAAISARSATAALVRRLVDPDPDVRREAAFALARVAGPGAGQATTGAAAAIVAALAQPVAPARSERELEALGDALERLARAGDVPLLASALERARGADRAPLARALAAAGLPPAGSAEEAAVVDRLIALVDDGGDVALAAADALAAAPRLPPQRREALARAFGDAEAAVKARLCPALASLPGGDARLLALLADPEQPEQVRAAAAWAARRLLAAAATPAPGAAEALRRASGDPIAPVAANARAALATAGSAAPRAWAALRLQAPDGTAWPGRWVALTAADGTTIWAMTDPAGTVRVPDLPPGAVEARVADPMLRVDGPR
jgi:HEAT repeat protein